MNNPGAYYLAPGRLGVDRRQRMYGSLHLNLLQLYFLTGILANYADLFILNNVILVAFVVATFARKRPSFSPLLHLYGAMAALSVINHCVLYAGTGVIPAGARTMPIVFVLMLACRSCTVPGLFERSVVINTLPIALLLPLGGIHFYWGRLYTGYLFEYMHGFVPPFVFAIGICALVYRRFNLLMLVSFFASSLLMAVSSSRRYAVFVFLTALVVLLPKRKWSMKQCVITGALVIIIVCVVLPQMFISQQRRYGVDYRWKEHIAEIYYGDTQDMSSRVRMGFWKTAIRAVRSRWLGFGNANFPYVVETYGVRGVRAAGHPHAGLLDALITAGYPGAALYAVILLYLLRIGYKDPVMRICLVWLVLQVFIESTLANRIIWPLMAIAERELQINGVGPVRQCVGVTVDSVPAAALPGDEGKMGEP